MLSFCHRSVHATTGDFHGFTEEMSFAKLVMSASSVEEMPRTAPNALPPPDTTRLLIERCCWHVYIFYPVLTYTAIFGSYGAIYHSRSSGSQAMHHWNIRLTLALALISRSTVREDSHYKEAVHHVSAALELVEQVIQPGSIAGIQAVLLLTLYSLYDPPHFNSWYLIGVASRMMIDLGLHQEPPGELKVKPSQLELRRRIFYCTYSLDR